MTEQDLRRMYEFRSGGVPGEPGNQWINKDPPDAVGQDIPHGPIPDRGNAARGIGSGFPKMETPIIVFDQALAVRAPVDVEAAKTRDCWLISQRAKELFQRIDPGAFDFVEAVTRFRKDGREVDGPTYWLCDIVRYLDALDERKSRARVRVSSEGMKRARAGRIDSEIFKPDVVGSNHVFRLMYSPRSTYCTEFLKREVERAGLVGFRFMPGGRIDG